MKEKIDGEWVFEILIVMIVVGSALMKPNDVETVPWLLIWVCASVLITLAQIRKEHRQDGDDRLESQ